MQQLKFAMITIAYKQYAKELYVILEGILPHLQQLLQILQHMIKGGRKVSRTVLSTPLLICERLSKNISFLL
jgi:hypothetical protein